jgi:hypothetical protein
MSKTDGVGSVTSCVSAEGKLEIRREYSDSMVRCLSSVKVVVETLEVEKVKVHPDIIKKMKKIKKT